MDLRDRIADALTGHPIGSGYYGTNVGVDEARDMADEIVDLIDALTAALGEEGQ